MINFWITLASQNIYWKVTFAGWKIFVTKFYLSFQKVTVNRIKVVSFCCHCNNFIVATKILQVLFHSHHPWIKSHVLGIHNIWAINDFVIKISPLYPNLGFKQKAVKLEQGPFCSSENLNVSIVTFLYILETYTNNLIPIFFVCSCGLAKKWQHYSLRSWQLVILDFFILF